MAIALKHLFVSAKSDGVDSTVVQPSDWNADHVLTAAAGKVLGTVVGSTTVSELPLEVDANGQSVKLPSGTTLQRPASPGAGMLRYNTTLSRLEGYIGSSWIAADNPVRVSATSPSNPYTGDVWLDSDDNALQVHNGTGFVSPLTTPLDSSVTLAKLAAALQAFLVPTGTIISYAGVSAPTGWLLCTGGTIGNGSSGASLRANADAQTLFELLWNAFGNTELPIFDSAGVASTRGSTATADFNANKRLSIPDLRGRVVAGQDDMGGTSANRLTNQTGGLDGDVMGATGGTETQTLTEAQMPAHRHLVANSTFNGSTLTGSNSINFTKSDGGDGNYNLVGTSSEPTLGRTSATGGGGAHNNVQPTIILNYIIKT